ncbi:hypothetical protein VTL71DRAFT_12287 [Oculimacula yallundae]|uniref:FAD-binding domain-containing protein n=1 Tax=Oculimacula yallundae TaxID=86028 RepID=A0ABR4CMQ6_9HELO
MQLCLDTVKDWAPEFTTMLSVGIEDSDGSGVTCIPLRVSTEPAKTWREDVRRASEDRLNPKGHPRVWLIGDAMHAMQPNRGMGGNQAMFDCTEMLPQLVELDRRSRSGKSLSSTEISDALERYEKSMLKRGFKWVKKSGGAAVPNVDLENGLLGWSILIGRVAVVPVIGLMFSLFNMIRKVFG